MERLFRVVMKQMVVLCIDNLSIFNYRGNMRGLGKLEHLSGREPGTKVLWHLEEKLLEVYDSNLLDIDEREPDSFDSCIIEVWTSSIDHYERSHRFVIMGISCLFLKY